MQDVSRPLYATVTRGRNKGSKLFPHRHKDGSFVVSPTRFEKDYVRVTEEADLPGWLGRGFSLRMSNPSEGVFASSLISPQSIHGWRPAQ